MQLSERERQANREAFAAMNLAQKADYIFAYYKLPLVLALVALVFVGSVAHRLLTHKEAVLYVAYANVAVPEELDAALTSGFIEEQGLDARRCEVYCYHDLFLASETTMETHQYAYASKLKTLAAVDAEEFDVVLMNRESYDVLSRSGFLLDLQEGLGEGRSLPVDATLLVENEVVLEDNQVEVDLGEAEAYEAQVETHANAVDVSGLPLFSQARFDDAVYLGIIGNTPRLEEALTYLSYLVVA